MTTGLGAGGMYNQPSAALNFLLVSVIVERRKHVVCITIHNGNYLLFQMFACAFFSLEKIQQQTNYHDSGVFLCMVRFFELLLLWQCTVCALSSIQPRIFSHFLRYGDIY